MSLPLANFLRAGTATLAVLSACNETRESTATGRDGRLTGYVQDAEGSRVPDAEIEVRIAWSSIATNEFWRQAPMPRDVVARARSAPDGTFEFRVARGPLYEVTFAKAGHRTQSVEVYCDRPFIGLLQRGDDPAGDAPDATTEAGIAGVVRDRTTGRPITGAVLRSPWKHDVLARSADDGSFFVPRTEEAAADRVFVIADGYRIGSIPKEAFMAGERTTADVSLEPGVGVTGRVVGADGRPVPGLSVLIDTDVLVTESHSYSGVAWTTTTSEDGRFTFRELAPGSRFWVRALLPRGVPLEIAQGTVTEGVTGVGDTRTGPATPVYGRVTWRPATVVRDREGEQRSVDGAVTEGRVHVLRLFDGKIAQWLVARETPHYPIHADGSYRVPSLPPGRYELGFWADGAEMEVRVVETKGQPIALDVTLGAGRRFSGKVADEAGAPIGGALLRALPFAKDELLPLVPPDDPESHNGRFLVGNVRVLTRDDGTYLLERIRSHVPIRLTVQKTGYKKQTLRVEPDETPPPVITLAK